MNGGHLIKKALQLDMTDKAERHSEAILRFSEDMNATILRKNTEKHVFNITRNNYNSNK